MMMMMILSVKSAMESNKHIFDRHIDKRSTNNRGKMEIDTIFECHLHLFGCVRKRAPAVIYTISHFEFSSLCIKLH
jgi:hypothetical protein